MPPRLRADAVDAAVMMRSSGDALPARPSPRSWGAAIAGAAAGAVAWAALALALPVVPETLRVALALLVFLVGPGAALTWPLLRAAPALDRLIVPLGFGLGAAPAIAQALGLVNLLAAFPYVSAALAGGALARMPSMLPRPTALRSPTAVHAAILVALAVALGAVAYVGRIEAGSGGVTVFGDYDSFDSTYYAAISAELSETIPPRAPFHAGHSLNYSYFPHLLVALVHRFADVPLLDLYFVYAWPALLAIAALSGYVLVRQAAGPRAALFAMLLLLVGSDLSFLVPLVADTSRLNWDPVIWSTNFFSPGAETLLFNTWTPTLALLFTAFAALSRFAAGGSRGWAAVACAGFAWLVPFKTFAFASVVVGLILAALGPEAAPGRRRRMWLVAAGTLGFAAPYLIDVALGYEDSQAYLTTEFFLIPSRLVPRLDLDSALGPVFETLGASPGAAHVLLLAAATALLFTGGMGFRLAGVPALWRAIRQPASTDAAWTPIAWTAIAGALLPFAIATEPYHGTLHFHQTMLFLMPLFVGPALAAMFRRGRAAGLVAAALVFASAVPSTVHYLDRKRGDRARPLARLDGGGVQIAGHLARAGDDVVLLHRAPDEPSLVAVLSKTRSVLAWSRYVRGSGERERDVDAFFSSAGADPDRAWETLRKYSVTHVVEARGIDAIHEAVVGRMRMVMETPSMRLYSVEETPARTARGDVGRPDRAVGGRDGLPTARERGLIFHGSVIHPRRRGESEGRSLSRF